ncbi:MAG: glycosyltransferase [Ferruginibacter sp.]
MPVIFTKRSVSLQARLNVSITFGCDHFLYQLKNPLNGMNILMIFRNNPLETSGAVTLDLFNDFKNKGHTVKLLVNKYDPSYPAGVISMETHYLFWKNKVINKLQRMFRLINKKPTDDKYHFHEVDEEKVFYSTNSILRTAGMKPDVIIILFAKNFVNAKNIYELNVQTKAPVYWMMYDTSPLTGGCHYSWDCSGYQGTCGRCPGLFSSDPNDITHKNLVYKKKFLDKTDISIVLASEWQSLQVARSTLFKDRTIHKILIAINPEVFKPVSKEVSHNKFSIPLEKKVIFFGAYNLDHERKGMHYLLEALLILEKMLSNDPALKSKIVLLIAGLEVDKIKNQLPFPNIDLGMLDNNYGIASAYQAADIFACPSVEDAGPSMINQSIMAGTPVVSFAQGVSLDIVTTGVTGYRAKLKDSHDLARGMYSILSMNEAELAKMKKNCRDMAMDLFHPEVSTNKWLTILNTSN